MDEFTHISLETPIKHPSPPSLSQSTSVPAPPHPKDAESALKAVSELPDAAVKPSAATILASELHGMVNHGELAQIAAQQEDTRQHLLASLEALHAFNDHSEQLFDVAGVEFRINVNLLRTMKTDLDDVHHRIRSLKVRLGS